jgi:hypothetical protein
MSVQVQSKSASGKSKCRGCQQLIPKDNTAIHLLELGGSTYHSIDAYLCRQCAFNLMAELSCLVGT